MTRATSSRSTAAVTQQWRPSRVTAQRCSTVCDLVLARCDEDLQWLVQQAPAYRHVYLYSKCGSPVPAHILSLPNLNNVPSPNVGSNDYAVLH